MGPLYVSRLAGLVPGGPVGSSYLASKHSTRTMEAMRQELAVFGISVTSTNPSFVHTTMHESVQTGRSLSVTWDAMTPELRKEYGIGIVHNLVVSLIFTFLLLLSCT